MSVMFWIGISMLIIPFAIGLMLVIVNALKDGDYEILWSLGLIGWLIISLFLIAFGISYSHVSH